MAVEHNQGSKNSPRGQLTLKYFNDYHLEETDTINLHVNIKVYQRPSVEILYFMRDDIPLDEDFPSLLQIAYLVPELLTLPPHREVLACDILQLLFTQAADKDWCEDFERCVWSDNEVVIRALQAHIVDKALAGNPVVGTQNVMQVLDNDVEIRDVGLVLDEIINLYIIALGGLSNLRLY